MSDSDGLKFDEAQVGAILRRAVEIQSLRSGESSVADLRPGVSLSQLQQAAEELGIDPRSIELAAAEIGSGSFVESGNRFMGGPWTFELERTIEGRLVDEDLGVLIDGIRKASGRVGNPKSVGSAFEWESSFPDSMHISVTPTGNKTVIRVRSWAGVWGFNSYLVSGMAALLLSLGLCVTHTWPVGFNVALTSTLFASGFFASRFGFKRLCKSRREMVQRVMAAIEDRVSAEAPIEGLERYRTAETELAVLEAQRG